ncbi:sigma 54-interacting transcriptional regulator [Hyphococcus sp.]|uniref:sigma 54-interacting transcriptional regulator n=1 Tax=Hyphococcus sp. TaxID=2038636 RepID=UPI0035C66E4C
MDDQEYDGASRSSAYDQPYTPSAYSQETYIPSNAVRRSERSPAKRSPESVPSNLIQLRQEPRVKSRTILPPPEIIGSSSKAVRLREEIEIYADDDAPVLITGETGVGKELVARHLHLGGSRAKGAFSPLNAGAMPETLAASELFGHVKGAFTGSVAEREGAIALANGGVLFLDEIGDMPLSVQTHLLRVLEDGMVTKLGGKTPEKIDFRLISATNVNLQENVCAGKFRPDLFYRINVLIIDVPPLRERGDDMIEIAERMIASHGDERNRKLRLTPKAADRLKSYRFPGNVRELRNVLLRAMPYARREKGKILPGHLRFDFEHAATTTTSFAVEDATALMNRYMLLKALNAADGNIAKAVTLSGRSRGTFNTLKKSLEGEDFASAYRSVCAEVKALLNDC